MMEARSWTEQELRTLILNEVTQSATVQSLNESVKSLADDTQSGFIETMRNLEVQASRIVVQEREMKTMRDKESRIFGDSQTFVTRVEAEQNQARSKLLLECESLNIKQQSIVNYVESLQPQVDDLKSQMALVSDWFKDTAARQATQRTGEVEVKVQAIHA